MSQAIEFFVDTFPFEFWDPLLISELGFNLDVLEVEIKVPFGGVADLEVVASSGQWRNVTPLVLVLPSRELKPSLSGLSAEEKETLILTILLPVDVESTGSWVTLEITSWSFNMLASWVHGKSFTIMLIFELPV